MVSKEHGGRHTGGRKTSQGDRGNPEQASPAAVARYLRGIEFPTTKGNLIAHARQQQAPDDVLSMLDRFEEREYNSAAEIAKEVGSVE